LDEAVLIWRSIVNLYRENPELRAFVDQASERMDRPASSFKKATEPKADASS
jgi:hypothetical protein